jgi:hypothetical protein
MEFLILQQRVALNSPVWDPLRFYSHYHALP